MRPMCWMRSLSSSKSQYTYGKHIGIFDGHKRESSAPYSGRSVLMPKATVTVRYQDVRTEVSRGHSRGNLKAQTFKCK